MRARWILIGLSGLAVLTVLAACSVLQQPQFGSAPEGERLQAILRSPHYVDGEFRNLVETRILAEGQSSLRIIVGDALDPASDLRPSQPIPTTKTDLKALDASRDTVVWLGHSSYFVLFAGKRILIDPVFSSYAGPFSFTNKAFDGTTPYGVNDLPDIDLLLITHDHWDHLDHATVVALQHKVGKALVPLGVGSYLEQWGFAPAQVHEADWYGQLQLDAAIDVHLVPARHYSGRLLTRNKTLWTGYVLASPTRRMLFSGDTGYGPHFKEIAQRFGGFDLVALDMGQYDPRWPDIHMTPEQAVQAAQDLKAKAVMPAHVGRFTIARHAWAEPFQRISRASRGQPYRLLTPTIGEPVLLDDGASTLTAPWWPEAPHASAPPIQP